MTLEEMKNLSEEKQKELYNRLKAIRLKSKKTNFSATYGAGPPKIAITAGIPLNEAKALHITYWKRNKAVKQVSNACRVKEVNGQLWLFNPISQFWYTLREEKDKFSTLNQGTGVYCFDTWVRKSRSKGIKVSMQYHDEISFPLFEIDKEKTSNILQKSIKETNEELKLNVQLGISIDFGDNYAAIH